jgi:hypothetical protein
MARRRWIAAPLGILGACSLDFDRFDRALAPPCEPGDTLACYSGAPQTLDVGTCRAGVTTCLPDGSAFGPCVGEIIPVAEDCATPEDDDCNGTANEPEAGCLCAPGAEGVACYSGPKGTENVGRCRGGKATCNADGTGWLAPCIDEVVPAVEECTDPPVDEDCDGVANDHCAVWQRRFGLEPLTINTVPEEYFRFAAALGTGAGDDVFFASAFRGNKAFDGVKLDAGTAQAAVVVRLGGASGVTKWATPIAGSGYVVATAFAVGDDAVCAAGLALDGVTTGNCGSQSGPTLWILSLDLDGDPRWCRLAPASITSRVSALTIDGDDLYAIGHYDVGTVAFGAKGALPAPEAEDGFAMRLDAGKGDVVWQSRLTGPENDNARAVALSSSGAALFVAVKGEDKNGTNQARLARLDAADGSFDPGVDDVVLATTGEDPTAIAVDPADGSLLLAGSYEQAFAFEGLPPLALPAGPGPRGTYLARIDSGTLAVETAVAFPGQGELTAGQLGFVPGTSDLITTLTLEGGIDAPGVPPVASVSKDAVLLRLDSLLTELEVRYARRFGGGDSVEPVALAFDSQGMLVIAARCKGTVDFGQGPPLRKLWEDDLCIAKLAP